MPRLSLGLGVQNIRKAGGGGVAPITTSRAFNSSGGQVGATITGDIPSSWIEGQSTVTNVVFATNNSVTIIGDSALKNCNGLTSITIPNSVTYIGSYAFAYTNLTNVTNLTIPNSVTSIGSYAFYESGLFGITIGSGVTTLQPNFAGKCFNLTSITIPNTVTSIGNYPFNLCTNLSTVLCYVAQSAFTGSDAFTGTASPLTIRARSTDASWTAGTGLSFQGNTNVTVIKNL